MVFLIIVSFTLLQLIRDVRDNLRSHLVPNKKKHCVNKATSILKVFSGVKKIEWQVGQQRPTEKKNFLK